MKDYWRFTPRGLRTLLERGGLEVDEVGSWGNRDCVVGNFDSWPAFRWWHSLRNEPDLPRSGLGVRPPAGVILSSGDVNGEARLGWHAFDRAVRTEQLMRLSA